MAVVGAGPAGLAATVTAAEAGLRVLLVDAGIQPGGQFWRHPDEAHLPADEATGHHNWAQFTGLRTRLRAGVASGAVTYRANTQVWFVEPADSAFTLHLSPAVEVPGGAGVARAGSLVLCPGGSDRQLPVPGWDLPGVMAAGGVQALLKAHRTVVGRRAVVAGTGPFLLPVATGLADAGVEVVGVCEAGDLRAWLPGLPAAVGVPAKAVEGLGYARSLARHRIPYRTRTVVTAVEGDDTVRAVRTARLDRAGRVRPGSETRHEVDLVALGWGFTPAQELVLAVGADTWVDADQSLVAVVDDGQRSTVTGVYVAGEATGVGGTALAVAEGELAGLSVASDRGRIGPDAGAEVKRRQRRLRGSIARGRAFAAAIHRAHPVPAHWAEWLTPDTIICRCEEVSWAEISVARSELGADDPRTVKLVARPGMGWCQGRICGFAVARLTVEGPLTAEHLRPMAKRSLATPVTLQTLADLGPEETAYP